MLDGYAGARLLTATANDDMHQLMQLWALGVDINFQHSPGPNGSPDGPAVAGSAALHLAAAHDNIVAVEFLLQVGFGGL